MLIHSVNCSLFNSDWSELFLRGQMEADELRRRGASRWRSCRRSGRAAPMRPPWLGQPPCHPDYSHQSQPCSLSQILLLTEASIHWTLLIVTSITSSKYASETLFSSLSPTSWLSVMVAGDSIVSSPLDLLSLSHLLHRIGHLSHLQPVASDDGPVVDGLLPRHAGATSRLGQGLRLWRNPSLLSW